MDPSDMHATWKFPLTKQNKLGTLFKMATVTKIATLRQISPDFMKNQFQHEIISRFQQNLCR